MSTRVVALAKLKRFDKAPSLTINNFPIDREGEAPAEPRVSVESALRSGSAPTEVSPAAFCRKRQMGGDL